jgi:hypothetical protein
MPTVLPAAAARIFRSYSQDEAIKAEYGQIAGETHLAAEALAVKIGRDAEVAKLIPCRAKRDSCLPPRLPTRPP